MTSVVVFDLGGVLYRFAPEARLHALAEAAGRSEAETRADVWGSGRDADADSGRLRPEEAFALASLGGAVDHDRRGPCVGARRPRAYIWMTTSRSSVISRTA